MDVTKLAAIVGLLVALSAASERLVEIVKGMFEFLDKKQKDEGPERRRKVYLQLLAVFAGIWTTIMARSAIPADLLPDSAGVTGLLALGLLASGGSGLWNAILTYVLQVKNIKEGFAAVADARIKAAEALATLTPTGKDAVRNPEAVVASVNALAKLDTTSVTVLPHA